MPRIQNVLGSQIYLWLSGVSSLHVSMRLLLLAVVAHVTVTFMLHDWTMPCVGLPLKAAQIAQCFPGIEYPYLTNFTGWLFLPGLF